MTTFKQLTLMAAILLGIQGLGASPVVEEEGGADKPKTPPVEETAVVETAPSSTPSDDAGKDENTGPVASKGKKKLCLIL